MAYTNHLLFNNIFLKNLSPTEEEIAAANYLVHESARDWYRNADFSSSQKLVETWIRPLLNQQTLDLVETDSGNSSVWHLVAPWERDAPLALCYVVGERQKLDGFLSDGSLPKGQHWMIQAVNLALQKPEINLRWVIVTNGDQWRLLDAHSLRRYEAFLEIDLVDLLKGQDDRLAAYLFYHIVRLDDSLVRDETSGKNKLDSFLEQSILATEATEKYLKTSVSDNLNTPGGGDGIMAQLCMGLVSAIDPSGTRAFTDAERGEIYRNATYLLYRLLFIFYAEARNLLPMDREDYRAISLDRLVEEAKVLHLNPGNESTQQTNLWDQLNTLFNAIQYSDEYMGIPPYNGGLFENEDKAFLDKCKIPNRFLAEALVELAYLTDPKEETPAESIDYRDLSVRHLGSLYEGMIEYNLFMAEEELLARRDKDGKVKYLKAAEIERKPNDEVLPKGKVYFAQSPRERKATGTHYTAEDLVERLVKQTVLRLLNERWQEFEPKLRKWLAEIDATPAEAARQRLQMRVDSELEQFVKTQVLSLRACDPAMGSGHILVHIAHQMTNFILWVLTQTPWSNPAINLDADLWRKRIVENCLYGVDINLMAVELAKLSLWLATMQLGQPLSFLDHHLKQGNSLLGVRLEEILAALAQSDLTKSTAKSRIAEENGQYGFKTLPQAVQTIQNANDWLEKITAQVVTRTEDIKAQEYDYEKAQRLLEPYKKIGDLLVARKMGLKVSDAEIALIAKANETNTMSQLSPEFQGILSRAETLLAGQRTVHWELEFSRIFGISIEDTGFDLVLGNPPFLGGLKISGELGTNILFFLKANYSPSIGAADYCSYFFRRGFELIKNNSYVSFVSTNTISQGDTRETALKVILQNGGKILYADRYVKWGGDANVEVNLIAIVKDISNLRWQQNAILDGNQVPLISSYLDDLADDTISRLVQNKKRSFQGDILYGVGFILSAEERDSVLRKNFQNQDCIFPYLTGADVNTNVNQITKRYAICFRDWPQDTAKNYVDLFQIVKERVKPQRDTINRVRNRERWWIYGEFRKGLREATNHLKRVLVRSQVSEYHMLAFVSPDQILSSTVIVFTFEDYFHFSLLQSWIHEVWLRRQASTMRTDIRYTPSDCFQTFAFPQVPQLGAIQQAEKAGQLYYELRQQVMRIRQLGLTKLYNLFNNPACQDNDICELRNLHAALDESVLACYGWQEIDLRHDFYPNDRKKIRFMPSLAAQREIFTRLIALNQQIASQEAAQGLVVEPGKEDESENEAEA